MRVPLVDLCAQHAPLRHELLGALARVLDAGAFIQGPEVQAFEREFAAYCEAGHAVGVASGTDALALALRALGIGAGDAVAVPAFTFAATAEAVCHSGARPIFVDIDPHTFTLDPAALRRAVLRHGVRAVIPVHLYGQPAAMDDLVAVAREGGAVVIEDAAQAHGARYRGRRAGTLGVCGCFSFYPTKNLGALGDAGAIVTNDAGLVARLHTLRDHGQGGKYLHACVGFNSRLDAVQAAALRLKLQHLDRWNGRRQALAAAYRNALNDVTGISVPITGPDRDHVFHLFVIRCRNRDGLRRALEMEGIATAVHYPVPLHLQPAFADLGYRSGDFPEAEGAAREVLALPLYPELSDEAVAFVCDRIRDWVKT
jgi:dTDP-4-amino-4,6-dideoxygalactose transaminase